MNASGLFTYKKPRAITAFLRTFSETSEAIDFNNL